MDNKDLLNSLIKIIELFEDYNKVSFEDVYNGLKQNEVHSIDFIGKNKGTNLISLSKGLNITRGGVTKIIKRLEAKGYIEFYTNDKNKKEKYLHLTESGLEIFQIHRKIHETAIERDAKIFENFTDDDKIIIQKFLNVLEIDLIQKMS